MNKYLDKLLHKAMQDEEIRQILLETRYADDPMEELCRKATEFDCPITIGEFLEMDTEMWSAILKSINGGATYPREYDSYEAFMSSLE